MAPMWILFARGNSARLKAGELLSAEGVDAADQRINPSAILVVHLGQISGLRQGVRFVDEQHDAGPDVPLGVPPTLRGVCHLLEGRRQERGHLADRPTSTR